MSEPDFLNQESMVVEKTVEHMKAFAAENRDVVFSQFTFDCNPDYGSLLLCLDTNANTLEFAAETEAKRTAARQSRFSYDDVFCLEFAVREIARFSSSPVVPFNTSCGDFAYQGFADIDLAGWEDFRFSDDYPGKLERSGDDYLTSKAAIFLSRVVDKLVAINAFDCLSKCSPFLCSVAFHDGTHFVVRIIDWPEPGG